MLDRLHFFIPFSAAHCTIDHMDNTRFGDGDRLSVDLKALDVRLVGSVSYTESGLPLVEDLRHPYESVPSSFSGMALKVFPQSCGKRVSPGIELKASPAKLLQGHNVFGSSCIELGFVTMCELLAQAYPQLASMLDFQWSQLISLDATYSARLPNEATCYQAIAAIQGISSGQTKPSGDRYTTTAYFGSKASRSKRIKVYLKAPEVEAEIKRLTSDRSESSKRMLEVMQDPRLLAWAQNLVRLEVTVLKRWLENREIPYNLVHLIKAQRDYESPEAFLEYLWLEATADLFKAFQGQTMKVITDDKVRDNLLETYTTHTAAGKPRTAIPLSAFRTYRMLRDYGWEEAKDSMGTSTFYRHIEMLTACGVSKASLQKLNDSQVNNIVPLLRFVSVDFSQQRPTWYEEPRLSA
jgi:II/X family phage/plasmid replication protein